MHARFPQFDLAGSVPHWGDHVEAVNVINGGAIIPPPIERYLIKVMRRARQQLDPVDDADRTWPRSSSTAPSSTT